MLALHAPLHRQANKATVELEVLPMRTLNWNNLTKDERTEYMILQMSPSGGYDRSGYLPEDCGECGACERPIVGTGW